MSIAAQILALTKSLFPTGRAFRVFNESYLEKLSRANGVGETQSYSDALAILYSILPDTNNFSSDDATDWERRLGLITNTATPLVERKMAIQRKMNHPGTIKARQNYLYVQGQLQAAGFDLYVYENRFAVYPEGYETRNPLTITGGVGASQNQLGDNQLGDAQLGIAYNPFLRVINHIDENIDALFDVGSNLRSTFFVGGSPLGTFANIDAERKDELRQLLLKLKPAQTVAYLFVNFV